METICPTTSNLSDCGLITNHLATVFGLFSGMASRFTSGYIIDHRVHTESMAISLRTLWLEFDFIE